jgi:ADP-ribose pyrophosphatase
MKSNVPIKEWKTISSSVVFEASPWFKIIQDTVELPNNRIVDDYYRIEARDYVLIYARSNEGKVLVERQYKHGLGKITNTFPAGFVDKGEKPLNAAKRELLEETGFHAKIWKHIGTFTLDGTRNYGRAHYFIAEGLKQVAEPQQSDMEELEVSFLSIDELLSAIAQGELSLLPGISIMAIATNPLFEKLYKIVEPDV